ncbi:hypothetical protein P4133_10810 [Pseudomonas aeruginosa]|nr:hypothetical protein [Pseudomonas aeruginosa]
MVLAYEGQALPSFLGAQVEDIPCGFLPRRGVLHQTQSSCRHLHTLQGGADQRLCCFDGVKHQRNLGRNARLANDFLKPTNHRVQKIGGAVQREVGIDVILNAQDIRLVISLRKINRRSRPEADTRVALIAGASFCRLIRSRTDLLELRQLEDGTANLLQEPAKTLGGFWPISPSALVSASGFPTAATPSAMF